MAADTSDTWPQSLCRVGRSDPRCWEGQRGGRKGEGRGKAVKCTNGGRASGTAELQRFTYPRVYRQLNEAQLGMQFLPLGHFLQWKCEVQPDRRGKRCNTVREAQRRGGKTEQWTRAEGRQLKGGLSVSPVGLVSTVTMQTKQQTPGLHCVPAWEGAAPPHERPAATAAQSWAGRGQRSGGPSGWSKVWTQWADRDSAAEALHR